MQNSRASGAVDYTPMRKSASRRRQPAGAFNGGYSAAIVAVRAEDAGFQVQKNDRIRGRCVNE